MRSVKTDSERYRNLVTLRLRDDEAKQLIDTAWSERKRTATLIRELVFEGLARRVQQ